MKRNHTNMNNSNPRARFQRPHAQNHLNHAAGRSGSSNERYNFNNAQRNGGTNYPSPNSDAGHRYSNSKPFQYQSPASNIRPLCPFRAGDQSNTKGNTVGNQSNNTSFQRVGNVHNTRLIGRKESASFEPARKRPRHESDKSYIERNKYPEKNKLQRAPESKQQNEASNHRSSNVGSAKFTKANTGTPNKVQDHLGTPNEASLGKNETLSEANSSFKKKRKRKKRSLDADISSEPDENVNKEEVETLDEELSAGMEQNESDESPDGVSLVMRSVAAVHGNEYEILDALSEGEEDGESEEDEEEEGDIEAFCNDNDVGEELVDGNCTGSEPGRKNHCVRDQDETCDSGAGEELVDKHSTSSGSGRKSNSSRGEEAEDDDKDKDYVMEEPSLIEKILLVEKLVNRFDLLPVGWLCMSHRSGMPIYLHKQSRVCTLSRPYFIGPGSTRNHDIPLSAVPCLHYRRALDLEAAQKTTGAAISSDSGILVDGDNGSSGVTEINSDSVKNCEVLSGENTIGDDLPTSIDNSIAEGRRDNSLQNKTGCTVSAGSIMLAEMSVNPTVEDYDVTDRIGVDNNSELGHYIPDLQNNSGVKSDATKDKDNTSLDTNSHLITTDIPVLQNNDNGDNITNEDSIYDNSYSGLASTGSCSIQNTEYGKGSEVSNINCSFSDDKKCKFNADKIVDNSNLSTGVSGINEDTKVTNRAYDGNSFFLNISSAAGSDNIDSFCENNQGANKNSSIDHSSIVISSSLSNAIQSTVESNGDTNMGQQVNGDSSTPLTLDSSSNTVKSGDNASSFNSVSMILNSASDNDLANSDTTRDVSTDGADTTSMDTTELLATNILENTTAVCSNAYTSTDHTASSTSVGFMVDCSTASIYTENVSSSSIVNSTDDHSTSPTITTTTTEDAETSTVFSIAVCSTSLVNTQNVASSVVASSASPTSTVDVSSSTMVNSTAGYSTSTSSSTEKGYPSTIACSTKVHDVSSSIIANSTTVRGESPQSTESAKSAIKLSDSTIRRTENADCSLTHNNATIRSTASNSKLTENAESVESSTSSNSTNIISTGLICAENAECGTFSNSISINMNMAVGENDSVEEGEIVESEGTVILPVANNSKNDSTVIPLVMDNSKNGGTITPVALDNSQTNCSTENITDPETAPEDKKPFADIDGTLIDGITAKCFGAIPSYVPPPLTTSAGDRAKVECAEENLKVGTISPMELHEYCKRLFQFKTITVRRYNKWKDRRKHNIELKRASRPALPTNTKLITCPIPCKKDVQGAKKKEFILNPAGKSPVCVLHEYCQHILKVNPHYIFRDLENSQTPFSVTIMIDDVQYGTGYAISKKNAKVEAARVALGILIPELRHFFNKQDYNQDISFFDEIAIRDPRVMELCANTGQMTPYQILTECLKCNFGMGDTEIKVSNTNMPHQKCKFTMKVGKHEASVICKNKRDGKQFASQAILQLMHPHVHTWGSLIRLYAKAVEIKEKKDEEHSVTELQTRAEPNKAILAKLKTEMNQMYQRRNAIKSTVKGKISFEMPKIVSSDLGSIDL